MIVELDIPFADSSVTDLSYRRAPIDLPVLDSLEHSEVLPGWSLSLRLLGASHQAVLETPWGVEMETVACMAQPGAPLPMWSRYGGAHVQTSFRCQIHRPAPAVFHRYCERLRFDAKETPNTLVGVFPGDDDALTYLRIIPGIVKSNIAQCRWMTVHAYPERRQLVVTETIASESGPMQHPIDTVRSIFPSTSQWEQR